LAYQAIDAMSKETREKTDRGGRSKKMSLTVNQFSVSKNSFTITFSAAVDPTSAGNPANYTVFDPDSVDFDQPSTLDNPNVANIPTPTSNTVKVNFTASGGAKNEFNAGDWITLVIKNVTGADGSTLEDGLISLAERVPGKSRSERLTRDVEDAISYPILTEDINNRPSSPVGISTGGGIGGGADLGLVASKAVTDVLGWKANTADPKGFIGALTQSFTLKDVEGHIESTWTPRTYAVQSDLGGGITGAQASLYMRAKDALDKTMPLLNGLYPLDPEADPEYVKALREMARSQMTEIVKELGVVGLPSILRIDTYFGILLGQNPGSTPAGTVQFDPDAINGTLGELRDTYGIYFKNNEFNNSVADEQDITNFRVISDYMTSLMQSWISNREFFRLGTGSAAFFGTQLVLISRQFNVIAETVNEARFVLDSVFIGPNERQALLLEFSDPSLPPMFLEDVFDEVEAFATEEGPRLLRDGGKISVTNNILPVVQALQNMVEQAHDPVNINSLPDGFKTARVRNSLDDLEDQLQALANLTEQVEQQVPAPESKLTIDSVIATDIVDLYKTVTGGVISLIGDGFVSNAAVEINSTTAIIATPQGTDIHTQFYSAQRIDVVINDLATWNSLQTGSHEITVINSELDSVAVTLPNGLTPGKNGVVVSQARKAPSSKAVSSSKVAQPSARRRRVEYTINGKPVGPGPSTPPTGYSSGSSGGPASAPSTPPPSTPPSASYATSPAVGGPGTGKGGVSPVGSGSSSGSAPVPPVSPKPTAPTPPTVVPALPSTVEQKLATLENRHDGIQKTLGNIEKNHVDLSQKLEAVQKDGQKILTDKFAELQNQHTALSQKLDAAQKSSEEKLANKFDEIQKNHQTMLERLEDLAGKFIGGKGKSKDDK
jgi:hypothetical protein